MSSTLNRSRMLIAIMGCFAMSACAEEGGRVEGGGAMLETATDGSLTLTANNMRFTLLKPETTLSHDEWIPQAAIRFTKHDVEVASPARTTPLVLGLRGKVNVTPDQQFIGGDGFAVTRLGPQNDSVPVIE